MKNAFEYEDELAALREELAGNVMTIQELAGSHEDLQQRLTAAEQRNAELLSLLRRCAEESAEGAHIFGTELWSEVLSALKPTESGASE
jgi:hypothetical protein